MSELNEKLFIDAFIAASKGNSPEFMTISPWGYQRVRAGWDDKKIRYVELVNRVCCEIERDWETQYGPQYQTSSDNEYAKVMRAFKKEAGLVEALRTALGGET